MYEDLCAQFVYGCVLLWFGNSRFYDILHNCLALEQWGNSDELIVLPQQNKAQQNMYIMVHIVYHSKKKLYFKKLYSQPLPKSTLQHELLDSLLYELCMFTLPIFN